MTPISLIGVLTNTRQLSLQCPPKPPPRPRSGARQTKGRHRSGARRLVEVVGIIHRVPYSRDGIGSLLKGIYIYRVFIKGLFQVRAKNDENQSTDLAPLSGKLASQRASKKSP